MPKSGHSIYLVVEVIAHDVLQILPKMASRSPRSGHSIYLIVEVIAHDVLVDVDDKTDAALENHGREQIHVNPSDFVLP